MGRNTRRSSDISPRTAVIAVAIIGGAALAAILIVVLQPFSSSSGPTITDASARAALPLMVLQREEAPQSVQSVGDEFSTNADAISGLGTGPTLEQLETWGRVLGYKIEFAAPEPSDATAVTAVSTSASLYKTSTGASDSLADREDQARRTDWKAAHSEFQDFQQTELNRSLGADQLLWLRFTGFQELHPGVRNLVVDDQIVFRVDQAWGFLGVVSTAVEGVTDRDVLQPDVEVLVRKQIQHMRDTLGTAFKG